MTEFTVLSNSPRVDVPGSLRRLADRVEAGAYGQVRFAGLIIVGLDGKLVAYGWGKTNDFELSGAFARASVLSGCAIEDFDPVEDEVG